MIQMTCLIFLMPVVEFGAGVFLMGALVALLD
jgi:hypothetical protein